MIIQTDSKESATRTAVIVGATDSVVCLATVLAADSTLLLADFLKTTLELVAVVLAWLALRRLSRGGEQHHDYGLGKLENLSSLAIAVLMGGVFIVIGVEAVKGLIEPAPVSGIGVTLTLVTEVLYGGANAWLWWRSRAAARAEASPLMAAQAKLFLSKLGGNVFIWVSLVLSLSLTQAPWSVYIDPIASLVIATGILVAAIGVFSSSVYDLLDGSLQESDKLRIMRELALHFDRYDWLYDVRSRRSGRHVFIDIHLGFDNDRRIGEVEPHIAAIRASVARLFRHARVTIALGPPMLTADTTGTPVSANQQR